MVKIRDKILQLIEENKRISAPIAGNSNLAADLGFDSLSFIALLLQIEETHAITFDIREMEPYLQVDQLIALIEMKLG